MSKRNEMGTSLHTPYFPDVGVIGLVRDDWGGIWQPRHHVLARLARYFNVVWFSPIREWRQLSRRTSPPVGELGLPAEARASFSIYNQRIRLPKRYMLRRLALLIDRYHLHRARLDLCNRGAQKIILYVWRPRLGSALDLIDHDLSAYHIDDEYTFSRDEKPLDQAEARLISRVDQVFIHSPALLQKKGNLNSHTLFVPNGVDYRAFATPVLEPTDLKPIPYPRIGYVGRIDWRLNFSLLVNLAKQHPNWAFVMVGPCAHLRDRSEIVKKLTQLPNVHFLGRKAVQELPAYTQHLDVCMMPYEVNGFTKFMFPMKLHEYLATGRPVVASPICTLQDFGDVITLAKTDAEWSAGIENSLSPSANSGEQVEFRQRVARNYDWDMLVRLIARTVCERLGPEYLDRFQQMEREDAEYLPSGFQGVP